MKTVIDIRSNYQMPAPIKCGPWDQQIEELEQFFKAVSLPDSVKLNQCSVITDLNLFIESHLNICKAQNGNLRYLPYLDRLIELTAILKSNLN